MLMGRSRPLSQQACSNQRHREGNPCLVFDAQLSVHRERVEHLAVDSFELGKLGLPWLGGLYAGTRCAKESLPILADHLGMAEGPELGLTE